MKDYKVPINRTSWLLQDFIIAPSVTLILWAITCQYFNYTILKYLSTYPLLTHALKPESTSIWLNQTPLLNLYMHFKPILGAVYFLAALFLSFVGAVPGIGRQMYILYRRKSVNAYKHSVTLNALKKTENPLFPPKFDAQDEVIIKARQRIKDAGKGEVLLGTRKRFSQELDLEKRANLNPEKKTDYEPFTISRKARLRHINLIGGTGSGKTAGPLALTLWADNQAHDMATITLNPKIDPYLLRVAVGPILAWRRSEEYQNHLKGFEVAKSSGEVRDISRWMLEEKKVSHKHFAFLSLSKANLSLGWNPLEHGDADTVTKKIIYSAENIGDSSFYAAEQESWLLKLMKLFKNDPDLNGRMNMWHISWFAMDPKSRLSKAVNPIVSVTPDVKFPHLADKIKSTETHDQLISEGKDGLQPELLLTSKERELLLKHENNRILLENLKDMDKKSLSALVSHISQLVEDDSISKIFIDHNLPQLDIREVLRCAGAVYVEVPTQAKPPQARALARMIIMETQIYSAEREAEIESSDIQIQVNMDEFASISYSEIINFLDKSRSSKIGFLLAHQSLANLHKDHLDKSFAGEVLDLTTTKIILSINDVGTRDYYRQVIGEGEVIKESVSETKSKSAGSGVSGAVGSTSSGQSSQHTETKEYMMMSKDLAAPMGFGAAQLLEEDGNFWRGTISLDHINPEDPKLPSKEDVSAFLAQEKFTFPKRKLPYFTIDTQGRLVDKYLGCTVVAANNIKVTRKLNQEPSGPATNEASVSSPANLPPDSPQMSSPEAESSDSQQSNLTNVPSQLAQEEPTQTPKISVKESKESKDTNDRRSWFNQGMNP